MDEVGEGESASPSVHHSDLNRWCNASHPLDDFSRQMAPKQGGVGLILPILPKMAIIAPISHRVVKFICY